MRPSPATMLRLPAVLALFPFLLQNLHAQCTLSAANDCQCRTPGQNDCDLLPDLTISWQAMQGHLGGPVEFSQSSAQPGRLKISASTPNIGHGPLEVRTVNSSGQRRFVCGTDTFTVAQSQTNYACPNGEDPRQIIFQNVYHKQGDQMSRWERVAGSMTYHSSHSHYHVNDWTTMTLRLQEAGVDHPLDWPVVATGAKLGFCLMDYGTCTTYNGHCRTSQEYGGGSVLLTHQFPNNGLNGSYGCGSNIQGISVGRTDIYSMNLDMMWINIMPGLCNGNYWIVAEVDPKNFLLEEDQENNWTAIPFNVTQQRPAGSGGSAGIMAPDGLRLVPGTSIRLEATPGNSYLWSNGATTRVIDVSQPGNYSVQVTQPCGVLASGVVTVSAVTVPAPTGTGADIVGPSTAQISATGEGEEILWYNDASGGAPIASGSVFTTPVIDQHTTYFASTRLTIEGSHSYAGKTGMTGSPSYSNARQWTYFDAYEPFQLRSVQVVSGSSGERHFVLTDNTGSLLAEKVIHIPIGTHRIDLDFEVPAGMNHRITAFDDNTEIILQLHRDDSGVNYPYAIDGLGSITGSSAGPSYYFYLYEWEVFTPTVVVESARTPVPVTVHDGVALAPRVFLDGPYSTSTAMMHDALRLAGLIPNTEPYTALGFTHAGDGGGEMMDPTVLSITGADAVVDWVLVELRDAVQPAQLLATRSALVKRSGHIVSSSGDVLRMPLPAGQYHVAIRHRNHHGVMTAFPVPLGATAVTLDLGDPAMAAWGTDARRNVNGVMTLWSGNVVNDGQLKYAGMNNDRDPILVAIGGDVPTNTTTGYQVADVNMDGVIRYMGADNDRDIILMNIGGVVPTHFRMEQLP